MMATNTLTTSAPGGQQSVHAHPAVIGALHEALEKAPASVHPVLENVLAEMVMPFPALKWSIR